MRRPSKNKPDKQDPARIATYFRTEKWPLAIVTVTGILYNLGLVAGPWFEGQLAQYFADFLRGSRTAREICILALSYVLTILFVQAMRFLKRLFVRRFANDVQMRMKETLYHSFVHMSRRALREESTGSLLTKAISDVDACAEGMRKFTTELFDTGVALAAYFIMLLVSDIRLTLIVCLFPPIAYWIAGRLRKIVTTAAERNRESAGALNAATLDRIDNALTYRSYGLESVRNEKYEEALTDYEHKAVFSNLWASAPQPLYQVIAMTGALFILLLGGRNVLGTGWKVWNIAAFSTYLSCFTKLSVKSSHAAKLFNAVQQAEVSWKRVQPYLEKAGKAPKSASDAPAEDSAAGTSAADTSAASSSDGLVLPPAVLSARNLSFAYPGGQPVFRNLSFSAAPGTWIGITGPVASGKSTLGRTFLCEYPWTGEILFGGKELSSLADPSPSAVIGYLGHDNELFSDTIEENIRLGKDGDLGPILHTVCLEDEIRHFPDGLATRIGEGGLRLSGGQQARTALARTLFHARPVLILDDPFAAVDLATEDRIMERMRVLLPGTTVLLISHRLRNFPQMDQVFWIDSGEVTVSNHEALMRDNAEYRRLCTLQTAKRGVADED